MTNCNPQGTVDHEGDRRLLCMTNPALARIAQALERIADTVGAPSEDGALAPLAQGCDSFVWQAEHDTLKAVERVQRVPLDLLQGIDHARDALLANTRQFARGYPANNALLWGARGMGKSTLIKAVHATVRAEQPQSLALIEIHREDITHLYRLLSRMRRLDRRALLMCDDLSFDAQDDTLRSLKAVLEGGLEGRPDNVLFYATSNRRHLTPRDIMENERARAVHPTEAVEEKVSLSDRFGLWLGFHGCDQATYLAMVKGYVDHFGLNVDEDALRALAIEWQLTRGARSGRVAWQFVQDLAGRMEKTLESSCRE